MVVVAVAVAVHVGVVTGAAAAAAAPSSLTESMMGERLTAQRAQRHHHYAQPSYPLWHHHLCGVIALSFSQN